MPDPFSIIGVLAVAMDGIDRATKLIDGISGAPRAIEKLNNELRDISQLLHQVNSFVHQIHATDSSAQDSFIPHLQTALINCKEVTSEVETLVRPYLNPTPWKRFTWTRKEQKTAGLERDMAKCKQMLNMVISFADLTLSARSSRRVMKIERGVKQIQMNLGIDNVSVVDSDFGGSVDTTDRRNIMTSQWIMQTDTVVEETFDEMQEQGYDTYHEEDFYFQASAPVPPTKSTLSPPYIQQVVESAPAPAPAPAKQTSRWGRLAQTFKNTNTERIPPRIPQPTPDNGQLIRKTKVSRSALEALGMEYSETGIYVRLPQRIDAATLQRLRATSERLGGKNSKFWWPDPPPASSIVTIPKPPPFFPIAPPVYQQIPPRPNPVAYPSNTQTNESRAAQMLRKTIVSRAALKQMGIAYWEDETHVFLPQKLEGVTVQKLKDLSRRLEGNRFWWA